MGEKNECELCLGLFVRFLLFKSTWKKDNPKRGNQSLIWLLNFLTAFIKENNWQLFPSMNKCFSFKHGF